MDSQTPHDSIMHHMVKIHLCICDRFLAEIYEQVCIKDCDKLKSEKYDELCIFSTLIYVDILVGVGLLFFCI